MSKPAMGARVRYCNHAGTFIANIFVVGNCNVVRANGPVTYENLDRAPLDGATHYLRDFPTAGFWRPDLGVFVVPFGQVQSLVPAPRKHHVHATA